MPADSLSPRQTRELPALITVEDASAYMLALPESMARLNHWQHAGPLCMAARERPSRRTLAELTDEIEPALMLSAAPYVFPPEATWAPSIRGQAASVCDERAI
jgi:hypothetical protein